MCESSKIFMAIAILKEMAEGRILTLQDGHIIGMTENGFVGFVIEGKVSLFSEIAFSDLVAICEKEKIIIIPS